MVTGKLGERKEKREKEVIEENSLKNLTETLKTKGNS